MSVKVTQDMLDLIGGIYDVTLDPEAWTDNLMRLAHMVGAKAATISTIDETDPFLQIWGRSYDLDADSVRQYRDNFKQCESELFRKVSQLPTGIFVNEREIRDAIPELQGIESGAQKWKKDNLGLGQRVHAGLKTGNRHRDVISFSYGLDDGAMNPVGRDLATVFLPHLERAVKISQPLARLKNYYSSLMGALDHLPIGVMFLSADSSVISKNQEAQRILEMDDGLTLSCRQGVMASNSRDHAKLAGALGDAIATASGDGVGAGAIITVSRKSGSDPFLLEIVPLVNRELSDRHAARGCLVFAIDPENRSALSVDGLKNLYGLTNAEAEVCRLIVECYGTREIAEIRNVSVDTVRTQMKSVFSKTGSHQKSDLVRLALNVNLPLASGRM